MLKNSVLDLNDFSFINGKKKKEILFHKHVFFHIIFFTFVPDILVVLRNRRKIETDTHTHTRFQFGNFRKIENSKEKKLSK